MDIALRNMNCIIKKDLGLGALKQQIEQSLTIAFKENSGKNQDAFCCMVKSVIKKSSLQMKNFLLWRRNFQ